MVQLSRVLQNERSERVKASLKLLKVGIVAKSQTSDPAGREVGSRQL